ncbi:MAG: ADP-ribose pyrophosphatase [Candidatus Doudnabacteria bacterium Gr01-1014_77]|uniref:ADP-ribose pyrophosphatase n=1 Tax=Candidatus Doudnabacteria bacterium Gr01-1014_77 TaxID=2017133 RepID=A0A554JC24_9BACT|nr:MAG: ADP-ribose pyrophosphatase [Candidatus Doudnabacteria bacterium Gr01-1014_77]
MKKKPKFKAWQRISRKVLYNHPSHSYFLDEIYLPDGKKHEYVHAKLIGGVLIVALNSKNEVCLISQYRYIHKRNFLELHGGGVEPGHSSLFSAKKELLEETGLVAKKWSKLFVCHPMPSHTNAYTHIYLAQDLKKQGRGSDMFIEGISSAKFIPLKKAVGMVLDGKITFTSTAVGILLAAKKMKAL